MYLNGEDHGEDLLHLGDELVARRLVVRVERILEGEHDRERNDQEQRQLREPPAATNRLVGQARSSAFGRAELWRTICGRPRARTSSNREAPPPTPSFPPSPRAAAALLPLPLFLLAVALESARDWNRCAKNLVRAGLLTQGGVILHADHAALVRVACSTTPHGRTSGCHIGVLATLRSGAASELAPGQPGRLRPGRLAPAGKVPRGAPQQPRPRCRARPPGAVPRHAPPAAPPAAPKSATHGARLCLALTLAMLPPLPRSALVGRAVASALRSRWCRTRPCSKPKARCFSLGAATIRLAGQAVQLKLGCAQPKQQQPRHLGKDLYRSARSTGRRTACPPPSLCDTLLPAKATYHVVGYLDR